MISAHHHRTVANTLATAGLRWNATGRKPADLYAHLAQALDDAALLNSPEQAAELARLRARVHELEQLAAEDRTADEDPLAYELTPLAYAVVFAPVVDPGKDTPTAGGEFTRELSPRAQASVRKLRTLLKPMDGGEHSG